MCKKFVQKSLCKKVCAHFSAPNSLANTQLLNSEHGKRVVLIRGCFQNVVFVVSVVLVAPRNTGIYSMKEGVVSDVHLGVSVVLVVSGTKKIKRTTHFVNNPLPALRISWSGPFWPCLPIDYLEEKKAHVS